MASRKSNLIFMSLLLVFSISVVIVKKYLDGNGLNLIVIISLFSIVLLLFSFSFVIPVRHWNMCIKERSLIEDFFENNLDYKRFEIISNKERFDELICFIKDIFMVNEIILGDEEIIRMLKENYFFQFIDDNIKKHRKLLKKEIWNYNNDVSLFASIKMSYKAGYYSKNKNCSIFWSLFSFSISLFGVSSIEAFRYYDKFDITFAISFVIVSIFSHCYDIVTGLSKVRNSLQCTYDYLNHLKESCMTEQQAC